MMPVDSNPCSSAKLVETISQEIDFKGKSWRRERDSYRLLKVLFFGEFF